LHTELSKGAIDYTLLPDYRTYYDAQPDKETQLVSCRYFTTSLNKLTKETVMDLAELDSFVVLICTKGNGTITDNNGNTITVRQGESILVPATTTELKITPESELEILKSWIVD
jgi:mannose-6-phosphate isomerase